MKKVIAVLIACLSSTMLFSQTLHWSPVSATTSGSMVVIGKIQINGVDQTSDQLELGVFCGDECRGAVIAHLFDYIQPSYYMVDPMVYGDAGNSYTFKLYDHSINQELDLTSPEPFTFTENGYGTVFDPYVFSFTGSTTPQLHWSPVSSTTSGSMVVIGKIQINGIDQTSDQLELGVFCGDECRGAVIAHLFDYIQPSYYMVDPMVYGDAGNSYTFRLYDHGINQELDLTSPASITFTENGYGTVFDPYIFNFTGSATQTYNLQITGYGTSAGGYYLIASPIDGVNPAEIEGMTTGDFDLYYFDESEEQEWRNYEANPFNLASGKGYLYAHKTDINLPFTGTPYSGDGEVTLRKTAGAEFSGWNLVGNPFALPATIDRDCYVMKADGAEIIASSVRTVNPMQGVFVMAASDNETMTFVPQSTTDGSARIVLNVLKDRAATIDRTMIRFEGNSTLPKFMLDPNNTKLYIPNEGTDYAVMSCNADNVTPVNFKARENGSYTLSVDIFSLDLDYLHLIDNKTGTDIDLLQTSGYTFEANVTDYAERFKLVYATATGINEGNMPFACYVDGEIRLLETCHGASLQIVDMTGRVVRDCKDVVHAVSTAEMIPGVYVLRLINGDDVRTQKIVVK